MARLNLKIFNFLNYTSNCVLPFEIGASSCPAGQVAVRQATEEELNSLESKLGPVCPPKKAARIRALYRLRAGVRLGWYDWKSELDS